MDMPMHLLILGGTQFVGRHIVEALLAAGHAVSVLNRGRSADALPAAVERLRGDRDLGAAGLESLAGRDWDACVDVSGYTPRQVRASVDALRTRVGRYVFVSAVSVYGDPPHGPVTEEYARLPPADDDETDVNRDTYGPLKVACEDIVTRAFGNRSTLLRPQVVAGPFDPVDRFSYWVRRATQPGEMLAPGNGGDHLQVIDARDVARFTVTVIEQDIPGSFNLAGQRLTWSQFIKLLDARNVVWTPASVIRAAGLTEHELPLYRPNGGPRSSLMHVSNRRALAAGLTLTPLEATVRDTRAWLAGHGVPPALSPEREAELIRAARGAGAHAVDAE
jgi:2'-hydroxyisoflavone reductase